MHLKLTKTSGFFVLLGVLFVAEVAFAEVTNWPAWRGPDANGSIATGDIPTSFSPEDVVWKVKLPGKGCSSPIIWEEKIIVTSPAGGLDSVLAFDHSGKELWRRSFGKETEGKHRNGSGSNPSPVTDGKTIFATFKSGTLAALDMDGTVRWKTNLVESYGPDTLFWDHGSSPVLTDDAVVVVRMHKGESWLAAFDKLTGDVTWKVARNYEVPTENDHGYTTPKRITFKDREALLVWGAEHMTIHDAKDGTVLWSCGNFNPDNNKLWPSISLPVISGDMAVVAYGRNDRGIPRLHGIKLTGEGDVTETARVWKREDTGTFVPSPSEHEGHVYLLRDRGEVECLDPVTGKTIWKDAFPKGRSNYYSSPLIVDGKIVAAREDGVVFVASIEDGVKLLGENTMEESIIASPVPLGDRLLLRGVEHLFCVGSK